MIYKYISYTPLTNTHTYQVDILGVSNKAAAPRSDTHAHTHAHTHQVEEGESWSRSLEACLFCRIASLLQVSFAKETLQFYRSY